MSVTGKFRGQITAILIACAISMFWATTAQAQTCFFAVSDVNFGTVDTSTNSNFDTTATLSGLCFGGGGQQVRICPSFGSGAGGVAAGGDPRFMLSGANQLQYNLYRNNARTNVWGSYFWGQPPTPPTVNITLNGFGFAFFTRTVYARIPSAQTGAAAGTFSSSFAGGHAVISYAAATAGNCNAIGLTNAVQASFNVLAVNTPTCSVSATTLDFGTHGVLTSNIDSTNQLTVNCTTGTAYTVGLNGGNSGAIDPTNRKLSAGASEVTYGLYRNNARTLPWGTSIGTNTEAGVGTGADQTLTVYGRVPAQPTPPAGTYTDVIVVTLTY